MKHGSPVTKVSELSTTQYTIGTQRLQCTKIIHSGKEAIVMDLTDAQSKKRYALKVIREEYTDSYDPGTEERIKTHLSGVPGCAWVDQRIVLTSATHGPLLRDYPVLRNAVLMPWFDMPTWGKFKIDYANPTHRGVTNYNNLSPQDVDTLSFARSLAKNLATLEERGIAHRDISDNNCFINLARNEIRLIDVEGLYVEHPANNQQRPGYTSLGTVGYQFHSSARDTWDRYADRFSGALLLCEMLCLPALFKQTGYLGDAYFTQAEIDDRDTACAHYKILYAALGALNPGLADMFKQTWNADSPNDCPTLAEWYSQVELFMEPHKQSAVANSHTPGLIVFVLDHSDSMTTKTADGTKRHEKMYAAVSEITEKMLNSCLKSDGTFSPRYHVAVFGYGLDSVNLLATTTYQPDSQIKQPRPAVEAVGIWQIQQFSAFIEECDEFNYDHTASLLRTSTTYMTSTFKQIEKLLDAVIDQYEDCPPPYVFHMSDGSNMDNGDPTQVIARIQNLKTRHGNVIVSNTFIGDPIMPMPRNTKQWPGVNAHTQFNHDRIEVGRFLRSISSPIPPGIMTELQKKQYALASDSVLLFPGDDHEMLHLAITVCGATVIKSAQPKFAPASIPIQVSL
jgi:serine/threonine protein kinase